MTIRLSPPVAALMTTPWCPHRPSLSAFLRSTAAPGDRLHAVRCLRQKTSPFTTVPTCLSSPDLPQTPSTNFRQQLIRRSCRFDSPVDGHFLDADVVERCSQPFTGLAPRPGQDSTLLQNGNDLTVWPVASCLARARLICPTRHR